MPASPCGARTSAVSKARAAWLDRGRATPPRSQSLQVSHQLRRIAQLAKQLLAATAFQRWEYFGKQRQVMVELPQPDGHVLGELVGLDLLLVPLPLRVRLGAFRGQVGIRRERVVEQQPDRRRKPTFPLQGALEAGQIVARGS